MAARGKTLVYMCYALLLITSACSPRPAIPPTTLLFSYCLLLALLCVPPPPPTSCVYYYKTDSTKSADRQTSLRPLRGGLDTVHTYYYLVEDTIRQKIKIKLIHPSIISHCSGASHRRLQCCEKQGWLMLPLAETPTRAQSC